MSIIQISKIQQRSGDLVDLPQLDQAEFGFAADVNRLFIGKTAGNTENIEVLTAYSDISFNQIDGAIGNLNISANVADGEVLVFDGNNWVNKGGDAGGYINLGHVSNLAIQGGGIDYVLTTDGTGNLSWTPKAVVVENIKNISQASPGVITTTEDHYLVNGAEITVTGVPGMTQINGQSFFIGNLTTNTFALYTDITLSNAASTTGYNPFPYTTATATTNLGNIITVGNGLPFSTDMSITFVGDTENSNLISNTTYYVLSANATAITVSLEPGGNSVALATESGLSLEVYGTGGKITTFAGGSEGSANAGGTVTSVQFNTNNLLNGSANFTFDQTTNNLTVSPGNIIVGNNITANGNLTVGGTANLANVVSANASFANLTITGSNPLVLTSITTGSAATPGTITGNWTLTSGSRLEATYADLAEYYAADKNYIPGTVLAFGGEQEVTLAGIETNKVAGVVSADPAYVMNGMIKCQHPAIIALQGRVPCKVKGKIDKGDMMISAGDGFAKAAVTAPAIGTVIGKALQNFDGDEGVIEVAVGRL